MPTGFERLASVSRATAERVFAHDVTVYPLIRTGPNGPKRRDEAGAYATKAIFYRNSMPVEGDAQPSAGGRKQLNRVSRHTASIRLVEGKPLKSDFFLLRDDGEIYEITGFDPDGLGGVLATLADANKLPEA